VDDIRLSPALAPVPHVYMPFLQVLHRTPQDLVVRSELGTAVTIDTVRRLVWSIDPDQPVAGITTLDALRDRVMGRRRFHLALFSVFAGVAACLALVGLYGVLTYVVGQMTTEIGVRLALGATRARIAWVVLRMGLTTTCVGVAAGVMLASWSAGLLRGFLFGVEPIDPLTYAAIAAGLLISGGVACLGPARRAAAMDPVAALRSR
jgi:ABC-type antimicrobial peptide transport system permease subunit